ncbi:MAG TPA: hypothetical protein VN428_09555 [Bryobacteraceae bacterium]|nr:hypothetical protein [Bryobacteraceae bacterium]
MSPLVLVLIIVGALFLLGAVAVVGTGFFLVHKAKQAGIDPGLWQRNPGVAAAKMIAASNPDVEIVKVDEGRGVVTLREKSTGKTVTLNFEDIKQGRMTFTGDDGETATVGATGDGDAGSFEVKTAEGTARVGAGSAAKLPSWVPVLQGETPETAIAGDGPKGFGGLYSITTSQSESAVTQFYKDALTEAGFEVSADATEGTHTISSKNGTRSVTVNVTNTAGKNHVMVTFEDRNK